MKVWPSYISPSTWCASAIERTPYARDVFTGSQAAKFFFTVDQPPDSPLDIHFNYNNANTDDAAQTHLFPNDPLFPFLSADLRPQYEQPNFPPPPQHVLRGPVPYDHPGSSSTTVEDPGFSLHAGLNEPHGLQGFNTGMASSEQMLGAGPSLLATQEQSPTTQEASRTHEEKHRAKKERDKIRKRNERSTNSLKCASIAELLDISLSPKKTLADRSGCLCVILVEYIECFAFRSSQSRWGASGEE